MRLPDGLNKPEIFRKHGIEFLQLKTSSNIQKKSQYHYWLLEKMIGNPRGMYSMIETWVTIDHLII
jgi:hypothetical protein